MNLIFLTSFFLDSKESQFLRYSKGKPIAFANSSFQKALLTGFSEINENNINRIVCLNQPNIGAFPFNYSKFYYDTDNYSFHDIEVREVSFVNIAYLKHLHKRLKIKKTLENELRNSEETVIICYDLYGPWLKTLKELKNKFKFKVVVIIPDLPDLTGTPETLLYKLYKLLPNYNPLSEIDVADGFVLLAPNMVNALSIENMPNLILEGIYLPDVTNVGVQKHKKQSNSSDFTILYSGALSKRNGIEDLVSAIQSIDDCDIKLKLYGAGELVRDIIKITEQDPRIEYMGQIGHSELLKELTKADLLINPRDPQAEFASYSFPSKTMEYMASGTPVLMYKLPSLPQEYHQHLYFINNSGVEGIASAIKRVMNIPLMERRKVGEGAAGFILLNKNPKTQAKAVLDFIFNNIIDK